MYNNIIFFLLVLLVYVTHQPETPPPNNWWFGLVLNLLPPAVLWALARAWFARLDRAIGGGFVRPAAAYHRYITRLSLIALVLFAINVYSFNLKGYVSAMPLLGRSTALVGLLGVAWFALFLALVWAEAFRVYRIVYRSALTRGRFVLSQLRFNLPIIIPYFLLTLGMDLLDLLPRNPLSARLDTPLGELVFLMVFMSLLMVAYPALVRPVWGLKPLPPGELRDSIEDFCRRHGLQYRDVMLWPLYEGEGLTAGIMGLFRRWRYVLVTRSLLNVLSRSELEAVLGHEIGHIKRKHLVWYFVFLVTYLILAFGVFQAALLALSASPWGARILFASAGSPTTTATLLLNAPAVVAIVLYFRFVLGVFIRNFERQADVYAYALTGSTQGLIGSLEKIAHHSGLSRTMPSWHHFSIAERVNYLLRCKDDPDLCARHDRKVRKMLGGFILGTVLLTAGTWWLLNYNPAVEMPPEAKLPIYEEQARLTPHDPAIHNDLGDLYYQLERKDEAGRAWERALALAPDNPVILNNLAWLLATKEAASPAEKERALALARRAAEIAPEPIILDTLAEAYFVNDQPESALETIKKAIELSSPRDEQWEYYQEQEKRFSQ